VRPKTDRVRLGHGDAVVVLELRLVGDDAQLGVVGGAGVRVAEDRPGPVDLLHPALGLRPTGDVLTVLAIGMLGFLLSVTVVRYRTAWALGNAFELPVWLVSGFLVPISILPEWVRPISWVLAPTWGVRAIRESALGGQPLPDLLACLGLGVGYLLIGVVCAESVLRSARQNASLALS